MLQLRVLVVFLVGGLSACIALPVPHDGWQTGAHKGVVRDSETGEPLPGATITLRSKNSTGAETQATTASDGTFAVGPVTVRETFYLLWLGPAEGLCEDDLRIEHPQYTTEYVAWSVFTTATGGLCRNEGGTHDVRMRKRL